MPVVCNVIGKIALVTMTNAPVNAIDQEMRAGISAVLAELAENKATQNSYSASDIMEEWASSTALKRLAEPIEIANAVLFLASKEASYITGHNLSVDGGRYKS